MPESTKVLLCVTGLSPQVVTETLYALAVHHGWVPNRVRIITTGEGARRALLSLLSPSPGWFERLRTDYSLPAIEFTDRDIVTVTGRTGKAIDDIRTPADNQRAADVIIEEVRRLTGDPGVELHVSIAGGRKTMGFYLGYALSLFGRPCDRLSHVLVSAPFESCWDFFYPTSASNIVQVGDNDLADARDAEVTLAEIPFVSLRHGITEDLLHGHATFTEAVESVTHALSPPRLIVDPVNRRIVASGRCVELSPISLALMALFARRRLAGEPAVPAPSKYVSDKEWAERFLEEYRWIRGEMSDIESTERSLRHGMDGGYFSSCKSRLHRELRRGLGVGALPYLVDDGGQRPRRYSLALPAETISFVRASRTAGTPLAASGAAGVRARGAQACGSGE